MSTAELRSRFQQFTEAAASDKRISDQFSTWSRAREWWRSQWSSRGGTREQSLELFVPAPPGVGQSPWVHPIVDEAPEIDAWRRLWNTATVAERSDLAGSLERAVEQVEGDPASLADACATLTRQAGRRGLPLAALTPALSSLDPSRFVVVCDAWLRPLSEYAGASLPGETAAYDELNGLALRWLRAAEGDAPAALFAGYPPADRFGVFCGWVARKSSDKTSARFDVTQKKYKDWPPMW